MSNIKKREAHPEILKLPVTLEDFKFRRMTQDWALTFSVPPEKVDYVKPLMHEMNGCFILVLIKVREKSAMDDFMSDGIDNLDLAPGDFE